MKTLSSIIFTFLLFVTQQDKVFCKPLFELGWKINFSEFRALESNFSNILFNLSKSYLYEKNVVSIFLPNKPHHFGMLVTLENVIKKFNIWTLLINDTYCCETIEKIIFSYTKAIKTYQYPQMYIIPLHHSEKSGFLESQIRKFKEFDSFNPRAIFILILYTEFCGTIDENSAVNANIFNTMWGHNLFATTLFILSECDYQLTIVSARPFSAQNPCRKVGYNGMKYFHFVTTGSKIDLSLIYHEPKDLQGCSFTAGTAPLPPFVVGKYVTIKNNTHYKYERGIDIQVMGELASRINFTYEFARTHSYGLEAWFTKLPNGTVIGIVEDMIDQKTDIAFGGVMPSYVTYYRLDYSITYKFTSINWFVTDSNHIPGWKILFIAFPSTVWALSIVVFLVVSVSYYVMDSYISINSFGSHKEIDFRNFFSLNLGMGSVLKPKSISLRVLLCVWAIYGLHWTTEYNSVLYMLLSNPPLEKEISTIQDLKRSKLKTGLDSVYLEYFGNVHLDKTTKSVFDKNFICPSLRACVNWLVKNRNFSLLEKDVSVENLVNLKLTKIHKLSDKMINFFVSIITNKGNSLYNELNKLLFLSFQSGLLRKWENDVNMDHSLLNNAMRSEKTKIPLGVKDLGGAFVILLTGLSLSFVLFLGELLVFFRKRNKIRGRVAYVQENFNYRN